MSKVSEHYQGERGEKYVKARQDDPRKMIGYRLNLEYFRPYLRPEHTVLDFGCGNGGMLGLLQPLVAVAEGLEVNPAARERALALGTRVYAGVDELPGKPRFDVVVSNHVLEHVRDVCTALETVRRSMKPGGLLINKLPIDDVGDSHQRGWSRDDIDHHLQTWTPRLFANVLFESGFEVEVSKVVTSAWHPALFPLVSWGLAKPAFWLLAVLRSRRQLFAVGRVPSRQPGV